MTSVWPQIDWQRLKRQPLFQAFALSAAIHLLLFGVVTLGQMLHWREKVDKIPLLKQILTQELPAPKKSSTPPASQEPVYFVQVDPSLATPEAPKNAKYYSAMNSKAANPKADRDSSAPKIEGKQKLVAKTSDTARTKPATSPPAPIVARVAPTPKALPKKTAAKPEQPQPLQPSLAQTPKRPVVKPKTEPVPAPKPEAPSLAFSPPEPQPLPLETAPPKPRQRPRTVAEAKRRQAQIAGEKMEEEGGVKQHGVVSLNVKATAFGAYDAAIIAAIQNRWDQLLDENRFAQDRAGRVVLTFRMKSDGSISNVKVQENNVGELLCLLCERAITDPAPYPKWPLDMLHRIGHTYRDVRFTFYYTAN